MAKYRKKPVEIEAFRFGCDEMPEWFKDAVERDDAWFAERVCAPDVLKIETLEGVMVAHEGDWIIRGVNGELYPCKDDIFRKTYEVVENA